MAKRTNDNGVIELGGRSIRDPKSKFTKIPNWILRDNPELHLREKALLMFLLSYSEGMIPRIQDMERHHGDSEKTIIRSLERLEEAGYIQRIRMVDEGGFYKEYRWHFPKNAPTSKKKERVKKGVRPLETFSELDASQNDQSQNDQSQNDQSKNDQSKMAKIASKNDQSKNDQSKATALYNTSIATPDGKSVDNGLISKSLFTEEDLPSSSDLPFKTNFEKAERKKTDGAAFTAPSVTPISFFELSNSERGMQFFFDADCELQGADLYDAEIAEANRIMDLPIRGPYATAVAAMNIPPELEPQITLVAEGVLAMLPHSIPMESLDRLTREAEKNVRYVARYFHLRQSEKNRGLPVTESAILAAAVYWCIPHAQRLRELRPEDTHSVYPVVPPIDKFLIDNWLSRPADYWTLPPKPIPVSESKEEIAITSEVVATDNAEDTVEPS